MPCASLSAVRLWALEVAVNRGGDEEKPSDARPHADEAIHQGAEGLAVRTHLGCARRWRFRDPLTKGSCGEEHALLPHGPAISRMGPSP